MPEVSINQEQYSWANISMDMFGSSVVGVTEINYEDSFETKAVKGRGEKPIGWTQGNYTTNGSITLTMAEVENIQKALRGQGILHIQKIPLFDITVTYENADLLIVTHVLRGCRFMKNGLKAGSGSIDAITQQMDLFILEIIRG